MSNLICLWNYKIYQHSYLQYDSLTLVTYIAHNILSSKRKKWPTEFAKTL